jgi:hypothetical protein
VPGRARSLAEMQTDAVHKGRRTGGAWAAVVHRPANRAVGAAFVDYAPLLQPGETATSSVSRLIGSRRRSCRWELMVR